MDVNAALAKLGGTRKGRKPKGLPKRTGKHHDKYVRAYARQPEKKLRRILKVNGENAARSWAETHNANGVLERLKNQREARQVA